MIEIPYDADPLLYVAFAILVSLFVVARMHSHPDIWDAKSGRFWYPLRRWILTPVDDLVEHIPLLYTKTTVSENEYITTLDWTHTDFLRHAQERGFEAQPLASIAKDWNGNIERSSIAYYYGAKLFPGAPNYLRKYQLHIRPFGEDKELTITGHTEYSPWHPVYALPHFLGIGLKPDKERAKEVLDLE